MGSGAGQISSAATGCAAIEGRRCRVSRMSR
jgi:hypothetical protein